MFLSDTGNSEFGQCFPRNLTYQMNPVNLGSFFGVLQGPFEAPPKYLEVKRTSVRSWYLGSLSKISKSFFFFNVFIFIFGGAGSLLLRQAFSACSGQGLLSVVPSLVSEHGLWEHGSVVVAPGHGLVAPWHVGSSQTRGPGWNWYPLHYRLWLFHWAPREAFQKVLKHPVRWNHRVKQWLVKLRWK